MEPIGPEEWVLVSDIQTAIILKRPDSVETRELRCHILYDTSGTCPEYSRVSRDLGPSLRFALATLLNNTVGLNYIDPNEDNRPDAAFYGALNDPQLPLLTDDEVFVQCKSIADFDRYTLTRDWPRLQQFFRWKKKMSDNPAVRPVEEGNAVTAETDGFSKRTTFIPNPHPLIPLPADTQDYLKTTHRPETTEGLSQIIAASKTFELRITRVLKYFNKYGDQGSSGTSEEGSHGSSGDESDSNLEEDANIASVCECRLIIIDGQPAPPDLPKLCVKILDDRLIRLADLPDHPDTRATVFSGFLALAKTSEEFVRPEDAAYRRLQHAQASVIPRYYGCHLVSAYPQVGPDATIG